MAKLFSVCLNRNVLKIRFSQISAARTILSEAYSCEEAWQKRLENPILKNINMGQYFLETDKKFGTKRLASGVDIDIFANSVQEESELDELEHLLYRFRRTKRASEMMESTHYAVIQVYLKFEQYESLFRILNDRESYGVFPDLYCYNMLMSTFLKKNMYKEAAQSAVLMMLQEDFGNKISPLLGLHSCQMYLNNCTPKAEVEETTEETKENNQEDEEDVTLVRVPFLRNPFFDDHFHITNQQHLIGKTMYLLARELDSVLGRSYQILGLCLYDKWDKALGLLSSFKDSKDTTLLASVVEKIMLLIDAIPEDDTNSKEKCRNNFSEAFDKMKAEQRMQDGDLESLLKSALDESLKFESEDIEKQNELFKEWENQRQENLNRQHLELDKERRLKAIEEKKEYLYWKEKLLFFFENEDEILKEMEEVKEKAEKLKSKLKTDESYVPPTALSKPQEKISKYKKLAMVKKITI